MTAKDILKQVIEFAHRIVRIYVSDLTDAELLVRSTPGTNHIAWQLGHMIAGTRHMLNLLGRNAPELPSGFDEAYSSETAASDDPAKFASKAEYLAWADQMKDASMKAVDDTSEVELDQPAPESMRQYAASVASVLLILGNHWLMHSGQFVPIRRKLGKKPLF